MEPHAEKRHYENKAFSNNKVTSLIMTILVKTCSVMRRNFNGKTCYT